VPGVAGHSGGGRAGARRKGGRLSGGAGGAELMDLLAEGGEAEAEAVGDVLLAAAIDEDGMQGLVEPLGIAGGLEEEEATRCVVHNGLPGCESLVWRIRCWRIAGRRRGRHWAAPGVAAGAGKRAESRPGRRQR
jgi:hypothetical protein